MSLNIAKLTLVAIFLIYLAVGTQSVLLKVERVSNISTFYASDPTESSQTIETRLRLIALGAVVVASLVSWQVFTGVVEIGETVFDRDENRWCYWAVLGVEGLTLVGSALLAISELGFHA
jgi:hypothetical protein